MKLIPAALLLSAALTVTAGPALAKAPPGVKTAEELVTKAIQEELERKEREKEAARDVTRELIDGFRDKAKGMPLTEGMKLADVIVRADSDKKLVAYRQGAADALITRFNAENTKDDPAIREVRREIAFAMLDLMKSKDDGSLAVIDQVLKAWYGTTLTQTGWKVDGKPAARAKACTEMKKKLKAN